MAETATRIYELQVKLAQDSLQQLKKIQQGTASLEKSFAKAGDTVKNFAVGLASALSVGALTAAITGVITKFDELGAAAQRVSVPVEEFSALAYAAKQSDAELAELEIGLKELQKSMVETETKGAKVLDALGIDKAKPQVEVLKDFAEAFKTIKDPAVQTNALLEVFGKSGLKLRPLLEQGAAGIEKLMQAARDLGLVLDEEGARAISDLDNAMKTAQEQTAHLGKEMVLALSPALLDILEGFTKAGDGALTFQGIGDALGVFLRGLTATIVGVVHTFKQLGLVIYGVAMTAANLFVGDRDLAASYFKTMVDGLEKNEIAYAAQQKAILGVKEAQDDDGDSKIRHTAVTNDNTKAVKAALDTTKKAESEGAKLNKRLLEQIEALEASEQEYKQYWTAIFDFAKAYDKMSAAERNLARQRVERIKELERLKAAEKSLADIQKTLTDATEQYALADVELKEYWKTIAAIAEVYDKLTPAERERALAMAEQIKVIEKRTNLEKKEKEILTATMTEQEKYFQKLDELDALIASIDESQVERIEKLREARRRMLEEWAESHKPVLTTLKETDKALEELGDKVDGYAKSITSDLIDFASGAKDAKFSFSDMATSILRDMAKMATQMLLIEPMMKNFKDWLKTSDVASSIAGWLSPTRGLGADVPPGGISGLAKGGVFNSPSLSQYSGGVYDSPRLFKFAQGGVFAEAGPEAIMPLKRGPDGSLGIDASGSGDVQVNVYNETRAQVETKSGRDVNGARMIEILVRDAVSQGFRSGAFDGVMGATYGLNRMGAR